MVRKVMFICAHNQTRSVAAEALLKDEKGFEVRSRAAWRGTPRKVTPRDGEWADEVYVMMPGMAVPVVEAGVPAHKVRSLWVPDNYVNCEDDLLRTLKHQLQRFDIHVEKSMEKARRDCWAISERKMGWGRGMGGYVWTWEPPSEEEMVAEKQAAPAGVEVVEHEYPYVPMWHIQEGERLQRQRDKDFEDFKRKHKHDKIENIWETPWYELGRTEREMPMAEKLDQYAEVERYWKQREANKRMAEKQKHEQNLLKTVEEYTKGIRKLFKR